MCIRDRLYPGENAGEEECNSTSETYLNTCDYCPAAEWTFNHTTCYRLETFTCTKPAGSNVCQCTVSKNGYIPCKQCTVPSNPSFCEEAATYTFCTIPCRGNKDCSDCPNDGGGGFASPLPDEISLEELKKYVQENNVMMYNPLP